MRLERWSGETMIGQPFIAESGWLVELDPRLKLLLFPLLVAAAFACHTFAALCAVLFVLGLFWMSSGCHWKEVARSILKFRWLLLVTVLFHLLLSPGRTLFGTTWLSLDGLQSGLMTALKIVVAIIAARLLTGVTSNQMLVKGLVGLMRPLQFFGAPVHRWGELVGLVFQFVPHLRDEGERIRREVKRNCGGGMTARLQCLVAQLDPAIHALADRADRHAVDLAKSSREEPDLTLPEFDATGRLVLVMLLLGWISIVLVGAL
ncbi:MAG: hypothetical protein C0616_02940 [Desulfuromonas sp.]|nr:MAG: hypothetical protein C0616_02940 [Desulfuromonas sp.]